MTRLRKQMVRPRKKDAEKKDSFVRTRVTEDLKKILESVAAADGMDISTFARVAMIEKARRAGAKI